MLHATSVCTPYCVLLTVVESCCAKYETSQTFKLPTLLAHQCWELLCSLVPRFTEQTHYKKTPNSGCKESLVYSLPFGRAGANIYQPKHHFNQPQKRLMSRLISQFFCNMNSSKNFTCPLGKLRTEFSSPIGKSTGPGLSDTTFFTRCYLV